MQVLEYLDLPGAAHSVDGSTISTLQAAAKIAIALARMGQGNLSNVKGVGGGALEYRIDFGPGYRIYLGRDGDAIIILLGGGTKQRQQIDIAATQER